MIEDLKNIFEYFVENHQIFESFGVDRVSYLSEKRSDNDKYPKLFLEIPYNFDIEDGNNINNTIEINILLSIATKQVNRNTGQSDYDYDYNGTPHEFIDVIENERLCNEVIGYLRDFNRINESRSIIEMDSLELENCNVIIDKDRREDFLVIGLIDATLRLSVRQNECDIRWQE